MRNIPKSKKFKVPKVAGAIGAAILTLVYALNSIPGGFFCVILLISVLILVLLNLSIFFKNIKKNIFEAIFALISIFAGGYLFFNASPSEMYRSKIVITAKSNYSDNKKIAFRENGLISISPKSIKSIIFNTEASYELKNDTIIIYKKPTGVVNFLPDTSIISEDKIIPIHKQSNKTENNNYKDLQIIEDNRK